METRVVLILLGVLSRLLPHPPNFTPVSGLALFSGTHLGKWSRFILPISVMFISDIFLGFHSTMVFVYLSFILITFLGTYLKGNVKLTKLIGISLISSLLFFFITNFGVWLTSGMYSKDLAGLINAYILGLPFLRNTVMGDLVYTLGFFYGYRFLKNPNSKLQMTTYRHSEE